MVNFNKCINFINKVFICLFSMWKAIVNITSYKKSESKEIVIVLAGHIGDDILFLNCMDALQKYYSSKDGYHIRFVAYKSSIELYQKHSECELDEYICLNKWKSDKTFSFFSYLKLYRYISLYKPEEMIVTPNLWEGACLLAALKCNKRFYIKKEIVGKESRIKNFLLRISDCNTIYWEKGEMIFTVQKKLLREIGIVDYEAQIGRLKRNVNLSEKIKLNLENKKYCVVVPGAQDNARRWEVEKFIEIIKYILKENIVVILAGTTDEADIGNVIQNYFGKEHGVINLIGKTSLDELIDIICDCMFVFGNDTGTIHIAATLRIPSLCLMSYKDKRFHPYVLDIIKDDDCVPEGIWAKQVPYCAGCLYASNIPHYKIGDRNRHCIESIYNGKSFDCLSQISVEDVKNEIEKYF